MFDIGTLELLLISVVALVVLGPERLPGAIKTVALWVGRLRRSFNSIKRDIEKEIGADDIRRQLRNEAIMEKFDKTKSQFTQTIDSIKKETNTVKDNLDSATDVTGALNKPASTNSSTANTSDAASSPLKSDNNDVSAPAKSTSENSAQKTVPQLSTSTQSKPQSTNDSDQKIDNQAATTSEEKQ